MQLSSSKIVSVLPLVLLFACSSDDPGGAGGDGGSVGGAGQADAGPRAGSTGTPKAGAAAGQSGAAGSGGAVAIDGGVADASAAGETGTAGQTGGGAGQPGGAGQSGGTAGQAGSAGRGGSAGSMGQAGSGGKGGEAGAGGGTVEPPPPGCVDVPLTKEPMCQALEVWRKTAAIACDARGLDIVGLRTAGPCDAGFQSASATCCKPNVMPPPPPPPPASCIDGTAGTKEACRSAEEWKAFADRACRADGRSLTELAPGEPRGCDVGSFHVVSYRCCR